MNFANGFTNRYKVNHTRKLIWYDKNGSVRESEKECFINAGYTFLRAKDIRRLRAGGSQQLELFRR